jgi:uroporphyrinogen decarboxylase
MSQTIFELAWAMRGMEQLMIDMYLNEEFLAVLLDKITQIRCDMAQRFVKAGVDILRLGDDVGSQKAMLLSPKMWQKWLKLRLAQVIASGKEVNPNIPILYHSDGNIKAIIGELCEVGVTILNPVQPECLDPAKLKQEYGDRLAFWGTVGTQTTMPFGTPQAVKAEVRTRIRTVGKGGGLVLAPTHSINADVPWENIVAFYEAAEAFG